MQIHQSSNKQRGTTIVELLIYLGLLSIFLTVLLNIFVTTLNFKLTSESASSLNQDTRYIFSRISYDVYNADRFTIPNSSELDLVRDGVTVTYRLDSGDILRNSEKLNSLETKIQSISFTGLDNTVKIVFTVQSEVVLPGGQKTQTIETTFAPR